MIKGNIGENIKNYRTKFNLTQQQLADSLSVSRPTVASYESGRTEPDIATMEKLAEIFEISVDELLGKTIEKKQLPSLNKIGLIVGIVLNAVLFFRNILYICSKAYS